MQKNKAAGCIDSNLAALFFTPALFFFKQIIPCYIIQPFLTPVMLEYPRPFHKFIRTQQEINPHNRKLKYKGGDKAKGEPHNTTCR